jgi:phosphoglucomutase
MQRLISRRRQFDLALACDTDHDRFGIVTPEEGLVPADHVLAVAADYLMRHRPGWAALAGIGKTVVSTRMLDRVASRLGRTLFETPVGFKWFVPGLVSGALGFVGEESAGAGFLQRDGAVWTTDKDGMTATLLAAEITARTGSDPACAYAELSGGLGVMYGSRVEGPATAAQRARLGGLAASGLLVERLAGDPVDRIQDRAPGDGAPIGGVRVETGRGWFAARPSGTEDIFRVYAESMVSEAHLQRILTEARSLVTTILAGPGDAGTAI